MVKCKQRLREKVLWPGIDREIERLISTCHACQVTSKPSSPPPVTMTPLPRGPWEKLCADLCGPFPSGDYLFVLVDYYSRYPVVDIIRSVTTAAVINCLQKSFATHGLPLEITTDNGPQFISKEFSHYLVINNIKHHKVTPYWPSANGEVERFNRVLKKAIQTAHTDGRDWKFELYSFLLAYRTTPHCTTGETPAKMLMNRNIRSKLPELTHYKQQTKMRKTDQRRKEIIAEKANNTRKPLDNTIQVGDYVLICQKRQNKLSTSYEKQPYKVIKITGPSVTVKVRGNYFRRHISHVKKYRGHGDYYDKFSVHGNQCNQDYFDDYENPPNVLPQDPPNQGEAQPRLARPVRIRRRPNHYQDYHVLW